MFYKHTSPTCLFSVVQFSPTNRTPTLSRTCMEGRRMELVKGTQGQTSMLNHFVMRTAANVEFPVIFQLPFQALSWCPTFLFWEAGTLDWAMQPNVACSSHRITQSYIWSQKGNEAWCWSLLPMAFSFLHPDVPSLIPCSPATVSNFALWCLVLQHSAATLCHIRNDVILLTQGVNTQQHFL